MEQIIIPAGNSSHFNNKNSSDRVFGKREDPQEIANLYGKAIDDLDIVLFKKNAGVATFKDATIQEEKLIRETKVTAEYVVSAIEKELELLKSDIIDALAKTKISAKLQAIKEQLLETKENKTDQVESLSDANLSFLHKVFNERFEKKLKEINDSSKIALAN